jgi:hypothetical protein
VFLDSSREPPVDQKGTTLDAELDVAYADLIVAYERELDRFGPGRPGRYPDVTITTGCIRTPVTFDPDLDTQLLQIYIEYGWSDVDAVGVALQKAATGRPQSWPWSAVTTFYDSTRNRLLLKIRAELIDIDRRSTERVILLLNQTRNRILEDWQNSGLHQVTIDAPPPRFDLPPAPSLDPGYRRSTGSKVWRMDDNVAKRLFPLIAEAVRRRAIFHAQPRKIANLQGLVAAHGRFPIAATRQDLEDACQQLRRMGAALNEALEKVYAVMPTAVLAVPMLTSEGLDRPKMEDAIGRVLSPLRGQAEELAHSITAGEGWVVHEIPDWDRKSPLAGLFPAKQLGRDMVLVRSPAGLGAVALANPPLLNNCTTLEAGVAELAVPIVAVADFDDARLPMMSTTLLASLVDPSGPVSPGTFTWVVWAHYVTAVHQALIVRENIAEDLAAMLAALSKIAALISLALLFTPLAPVAGISALIPEALAAVSSALGIGLIALQAFTVADQVAELNTAVRESLAAVDSQSPATMAALSELLATRSVTVEQITVMVLTELGWVVGANAFPEFKLVMHLRGYYYDLDTLLEG